VAQGAARDGWPLRLALAGDTMLGRGVAQRLAEDPSAVLVAPEVAEVAKEADLVLLNLECCISERGERWPDPYKPFFFRAPPGAIRTLVSLGTNCVTLANNHALDYGVEALEDTFEYLDDAGIAWVGAGPDLQRARLPVVLEAKGLRIAVAGASDHPKDFAAGPQQPGIAYADLRTGVPGWLEEVASRGRSGLPDAPHAVVVTPHWGPNMVASPVPHVRRAAACLIEAGATLVAGHSAHVFHGVSGAVLYDLGDFLDDYATDPLLRNDLGLLFVVTLDAEGPRRIEAVPLTLDYCHTRLATGEDAAWIVRRFRAACEELGTEAAEEDGRLVVDYPRSGSGPKPEAPEEPIRRVQRVAAGAPVESCPPVALVVTCRSFGYFRQARKTIRRTVPDGRVVPSGYRSVLCVRANEDPVSLARRVISSCGLAVARVTAVLDEVPSEQGALRLAAVQVAVHHVRPGESFAFRIHKRGTHKYTEPTPKLEFDIGGAIWGALVERDKRVPRVDLTNPDVLVNAEVFGETTLVGLVRRCWHEEPASGDSGPSLARIAAERGVRDERVLEAMRGTSRAGFVPPEYAHIADRDEPVPIGHHQVTTQPSLVAAMLESLALEGYEKVLEIGTGYGYQTALLAKLAREVWSIERWDDLAQTARTNLTASHITNAEVVTGDGSEGLGDHAPYDAIVISAAFPTVPAPLVAQLVARGRLVQPIGPGGNEEVILFEKQDSSLRRVRLVTFASFVRLIGVHGFAQ
jgi:protein-L-isoaspartate(D-aspartate) O-methyltransferase